MRVGLFVTCLVDLMRPSIGLAALDLLEAAGVGVYVPPTQPCCGQACYNSGDRADTLSLAKKVVAEFEGCDYVVAPSGSCSGMIRTRYAELFAGDREWSARVASLAAKTFELTDFLVNVARLERVPGTYRGTITYHDSCAGLREMGVKSQPRALLAKMSGARLTEMADCEMCCGFGGTFAVKNPDVSTAMADDKCDAIEASGADVCTALDASCLLQIGGRLARRGSAVQTMHLAEILASEAPA